MAKDKVLYDHLINLLDQVMARLNAVHASANDYNTGIQLYRAEIHTIQAIGQNLGINMSELALVMNVTKGAISQTVTKLEKKKLVRKSRIGADNREVVLVLTDLGWKGYNNHEEIHDQMYHIIRQYFGSKFNSRVKAYTSVMNELNEIMDMIEKRSKRS